MIKYALRCDSGHHFEAWFQNFAAYDEQAAARQLTCPGCGSDRVSKAPMAPSLARSQAVAPAGGQTGLNTAGPHGRAFLAALREFRQMVMRECDDVGEKFAEEARKIHCEEAGPRGIHGIASLQEMRDLRAEGIEVLPLPVLPDDLN